MRCRAVIAAFVSGKALAAGSSPLLSAFHPLLGLRYINHDLLQIIIRINELNIAALGPNFLVRDRILASSQYTSCICLQFIADSLDPVRGSIVVVSSVWQDRDRNMNMV